MKVLFLDVDGVLNCTATRERIRGVVGVEERLCDKLRRVVGETDCNVVLSSTWRRHRNMLPYLFVKLGDKIHSRYIGDTPTLPDIRGKEIALWLSGRPDVTQFAIVDDNDDMGDLLPRLVQTSWSNGLTDADADKLIAMLS